MLATNGTSSTVSIKELLVPVIELGMLWWNHAGVVAWGLDPGERVLHLLGRSCII
jgi:hypothetical protein